MKSKKYKLLVLSDLNDSTLDILKSSVSLAKIIDGEINFFYVKKPTDIVGKENQLSALRTINKEHTVIDNKIKTVLKTISSDIAFDINYSFTFGNVKNEIENGNIMIIFSIDENGNVLKSSLKFNVSKSLNREQKNKVRKLIENIKYTKAYISNKNVRAQLLLRFKI